jgi:hypothetical protein
LALLGLESREVAADALVVVVHGDRQRLLGLLLPHDKVLKVLVDLRSELGEQGSIA